jgi:hypothetical protein
MCHNNFGEAATVQVGGNDGEHSTLNHKGLGGKEIGPFTISFKEKQTDQNEKEREQKATHSVRAISLVTDENVYAHMVFLISSF